MRGQTMAADRIARQAYLEQHAVPVTPEIEKLTMQTYMELHSFPEPLHGDLVHELIARGVIAGQTLDAMQRAELTLLRGYVADVATLDPAAVVALLRFAGYTDAADALDGAQRAEHDGPRDSVFI